MQSQQQIREQLTNKIIQSIEAGIVPWVRPWKSGSQCGFPRNIISGRLYRGVNPWLLEIAKQQHGFSSQYWATFDQWHKLGGKVMRRPANVPAGSWGTPIVFCQVFEKQEIDPDSGEEVEREIVILKTYTLFNLDQVEGKKLDRFRPKFEEPTESTMSAAYEEAENIVDWTGAEIRHGGTKAYYSRPTPAGSWPHHSTGDHIQIPLRNSFLSDGNYFETLFHELAHWSEVRLGWDHEKEGYATGELVAEMAACYLAAALDLPTTENIENHAAYLKHWLEQMRQDPRHIFRVSTLR